MTHETQHDVKIGNITYCGERCAKSVAFCKRMQTIIDCGGDVRIGFLSGQDVYYHRATTFSPGRRENEIDVYYDIGSRDTLTTKTNINNHNIIVVDCDDGEVVTANEYIKRNNFARNA